MCVKDVVIQNQVGLHARPATFFIQKANEFKSSIWVEKDDRKVNAKSLLGVLSLGIVGGTTIKIIVDGSDEKEVPEVLLSGNHAKINDWRRAESLIATMEKRPDMLKYEDLTEKDKKLLKKHGESVK